MIYIQLLYSSENHHHIFLSNMSRVVKVNNSVSKKDSKELWALLDQFLFFVSYEQSRPPLCYFVKYRCVFRLLKHYVLVLFKVIVAFTVTFRW